MTFRGFLLEALHWRDWGRIINVRRSMGKMAVRVDKGESGGEA